MTNSEHTAQACGQVGGQVGAQADKQAKIQALRWLAKAYADVPNAQCLSAFPRESFACLGANPADSDAVARAGETCLHNPDAARDLRVEFTGLFSGFQRECPFPYESVYTSAECLMQQEAMDAAIEAYQAAGFAFPGAYVEPADFISYQLDFVAFLLEQGNEEGARAWAAQHLANWLPAFTQDVLDRSNEEYFAALAHLSLCVVYDSPLI